MLYAILLALGILIAGPASAGWTDCSGGSAPNTPSQRQALCYVFSNTDAAGTVKSFEGCYDVDWAYYNDGEAESLCLDVCTSHNTATCSEYVTVCKDGTDGKAHYPGVPGMLIRPRLEPGIVAGAGSPVARATCK